MPDINKINIGSPIEVDKVVHILEGSFTYTYTTSNAGGLYSIPNPEPGVIFLPVSIFSINNGETWITDLYSGYFVNEVPDFLTCSTPSEIRYRWASFRGPSGSLTVLYKTWLMEAIV